MSHSLLPLPPPQVLGDDVSALGRCNKEDEGWLLRLTIWIAVYPRRSRDLHLHLLFSQALWYANNVPGKHNGENLRSLLHTTPVCRTRVYPSVTSQEFWGLIALLQFVNRMELPHRKEQTEKTGDYHFF